MTIFPSSNESFERLHHAGGHSRGGQFTIENILAWADAYHARTGGWPKYTSGPIPESLGDTWRKVDNALRYGLRGLPGGSTLARLLQEQRGVRNVKNLPLLTEELILQWADQHQARQGLWPNEDAGSPCDGRRTSALRNTSGLGLGEQGQLCS